jgi:chemotaxis protein MotB
MEMGTQTNAAPVIIKRKKVVGGDGHHGGAWKVAYADFVTAMMAFFMLMWLLNATTEKQRKGLADYFSPTIAANRISGGGDGSFGGESVFSENVLTQIGTGATILRPTEIEQARGTSGTEARNSENDAQFKDIADALSASGGESAIEDNVLRHVVTKITDEGLIIEFFDRPGAPLFQSGSTIPEPRLLELAKVLVNALKITANNIAIEGHVRAEPIVRANPQTWPLSINRAEALRQNLTALGFPPERIERITGHADREAIPVWPMAERNNRIEIVLLRH